MWKFIVSVLVVGGLSFWAGTWLGTQKNVGSVQYASEYHATSTQAGTAAGLNNIFERVGTLGSITIVSSSAAGGFTVYDADSVTSTPTTTIAVFPASATAGTYVFDVGLTQGLRITVPSNFNGNFITTYR